MKPKYFFATPALGDSVTVSMLYAAYPDKSFYADYLKGSSNWVESCLTLNFFENADAYHPCNLKDVNQHFNNISAHKLTTPSVIAKEQQLPQTCGIESAT
jgi:hypothetical protein